jgi:hypothetical protein
MKILEKNGSCHVVELEENDQVQLLVPASLGRTCVYLSVVDGELCIEGGASIIREISGKGMNKKFRK